MRSPAGDGRAGDLVFSGGTPFLLAGSVLGAIEAVSALSELGAEIIVPGHGPVCGPAGIDAVLRYLRFVRDLAEQSLAAGAEPLGAARQADLGEFAALTDPERLVGSLYRARAELRGTARGAPVDFAAALAGMLEYNGGHPLTCLA